MQDDHVLTEYYKIIDIVGEFDKRLLTVKSWGVTLSLVALGLAFQFKAPGYFLVAAASAFSFWIIEGSMKSHQMRYYPRMREIEAFRAENGEADFAFTSPRIDWSWSRARAQLLGANLAESSPPVIRGQSRAYRFRYLGATVMFPHLVTFVIGLALFLFALCDMVLWQLAA